MISHELRIGNYIGDVGSQPYQVTAEGIAKIHQIESSGKFCIDANKIPITEEWLLRLGFLRTDPVFQDVKNSYEIPGFGRVCIINGKLVSDEFYFLDGVTVDIKYVHQLQNLYFAMTGRELTLN